MRDANRQAIADAAGTWAEAQAALEAVDAWRETFETIPDRNGQTALHLGDPVELETAGTLEERHEEIGRKSAAYLQERGTK